MRALRDPDAFMPTDLGIRRAARALGLPDDPAHLCALTEAGVPGAATPWSTCGRSPAGRPHHHGQLPPPEDTPTTKRSLRGRDAA
jgi:3-methyladenine DNA glycosylase/8-oxoguanine DNA glycosylase